MNKIDIYYTGIEMVYNVFDPNVFNVIYSRYPVIINTVNDEKIHMFMNNGTNDINNTVLGVKKLIDLNEFGKISFYNIVKKYNIPFPNTILSKDYYNSLHKMDIGKTYLLKSLRSANSEAVTEIDYTKLSKMMIHIGNKKSNGGDEFNDEFNITGSDMIFEDIKNNYPLVIQDKIDVKKEYRVIIGHNKTDFIIEKRKNYPHGPNKSHHITFKKPKRLYYFINKYLTQIIKDYDIPYCSFDVLEDNKGDFYVIEITKTFGTFYNSKEENMFVRNYITSSLYDFIKDKKWIE